MKRSTSYLSDLHNGRRSRGIDLLNLWEAAEKPDTHFIGPHRRAQAPPPPSRPMKAGAVRFTSTSRSNPGKSCRWSSRRAIDSTRKKKREDRRSPPPGSIRSSASIKSSGNPSRCGDVLRQDPSGAAPGRFHGLNPGRIGHPARKTRWPQALHHNSTRKKRPLRRRQLRPPVPANPMVESELFGHCPRRFHPAATDRRMGPLRAGRTAARLFHRRKSVILS